MRDIDERETKLEAQIESHRRTAGAPPEWAERARAQLRRDCSEIERAIVARQMDSLGREERSENGRVVEQDAGGRGHDGDGGSYQEAA